MRVKIWVDADACPRVVGQGGVTLFPHGELYTEENVVERLSLRDFMQQLRAEGLVQGNRTSLARQTGTGLRRPLTAC